MVWSVSGRELKCSYDTFWTLPVWTRHSYCKINSIDFSASQQSEKHAFSGSSSEKAEAKTLFIHNSPNLDFIPIDAIQEFPKLNGLFLKSCNLQSVKSGLFTSDFEAIELLYLGQNKIKSIEETAFEHLVKLKWISLEFNKIQSLPVRIFKSNLQLNYINFKSNEIHSISNKFFDGLKQMKIVRFDKNQCVNATIGCETCTISDSALNTDLITCFQQNRLERLEADLFAINGEIN
jgi:Leucine-rich repeat (LRR) protein